MTLFKMNGYNSTIFIVAFLLNSGQLFTKEFTPLGAYPIWKCFIAQVGNPAVTKVIFLKWQKNVVGYPYT